MQALLLVKPGPIQPLAVQERPTPTPTPTPRPGEAVVRLHAAALNHRDLFLVRGLRSSDWPPYVPGSDGAGVVAAVGEGVSGWREGDPVVIHPTLYCVLRPVPFLPHRRAEPLRPL